MITNEIIIVCFGIVTLFYLIWGTKTLPIDWQMAAVVPIKKISENRWTGLNLTFYGFLVANAVVIATAVFLVLMLALGTPPLANLIILLILFLTTLPSARLIARWIEKKANTFTIGGACFVGILLAPPLLFFLNFLLKVFQQPEINILATLAALMISYNFGEGLGRLACISFGCCYGKPLDKYPFFIKNMFSRFYFIFLGQTKKISYAENWAGLPIFPIQAVTGSINVLTGLICLALFIYEQFHLAMIISLAGSLGWRVLSEYFRADYRGEGRWSTYQKLSLIGLIYGLIVVAFMGSVDPLNVDLLKGIKGIWNLSTIVPLQFLWLVIFFYLGRSKVTGSELSFFVHPHRI